MKVNYALYHDDRSGITVSVNAVVPSLPKQIDLGQLGKLPRMVLLNCNCLVWTQMQNPVCSLLFQGPLASQHKKCQVATAVSRSNLAIAAYTHLSHDEGQHKEHPTLIEGAHTTS